MNRFEYDLTSSSCAALTIQITQQDLNEEHVFCFVFYLSV